MNGQTPPRRKRPTRPDLQPTETPRPTRRTKSGSTTAKAARPKGPPAAKAPRVEPTKAEVPPAETAPTPAGTPRAPAATPPAPAGTPPLAALPDRFGDVSAAITPRQLAFFALLAALIVTLIRRLLGRRRGAG